MKKIISIILLLTLCLGLFAGCGETPTEPSTTVPAPTEPAVNNLPNAKALLFNKYKPASKDGVTTKAAAFEVINTVLVAGESYPVEWSVEVTTGAQDAVKVVPGSDGHVKVEVPEKPAEAVEFTLTATIKDTNGNSESVSFKYIVPKFRVNTFAEYVAAKGGDNVVTEGVISGIIAKSLGASNNCIYFQDADGGYYAYGMEKDPITDLNLAVGMTIRVSGVKDVFNGTHEIKDVAVEIVSTEKADVVATDYTERYQNAADLKVEELVYQQAMLVTIKGVEITGQEASNGYYKFKLGELESYIRISGSTCPLTADEKAALIAAHSEHTGWIANVTGVICVYNGAFYLTPVSVDAFEYIGLPEKSDAEKVEFEKGNLSIETTIAENTAIELPTAGVTYDQVAITWAVEGDCAVIENGKLVITVPADGSDATAILTATLTAGDSTDTVSFTLAVSLPKDVTVLEAIEMGSAMEHNTYTSVKYYVTGIITEVYNTTYGNMKIQDAQGNILTLYGTYDATGENRYDAMSVQPVAGDLITIYGVIGQYNDTPQIKNGWIVAHDTTLSVKDAIDMGAAMEHNTYTPDKYVVTGVITEVYNDKYGNMYITDEAGNILTVYGTYNADGTVRYDALETKPVAGDTVAVYGIVGQYSGTPQIKNGWIVVHTPASSAPTDPVDPIDPVDPTVPTDPTDPTEPTDPTDPTEPAETTTLATGDKVVIYAPAYNLALSATKTGFYNIGVDVSAGFDGLSAAEIWVVTVNEDGSYTFVSESGSKLALAESYSSLNDTGVYDKWEIIAKEGTDGIFYLKNIGRGNYLEWYASKNNWSSYATSSLSDLFELRFYKVG